MKKAFLAAATALSMAAVPAAAQVDDADMTPEQQTMYDDLTADQRTVFDTYTTDQQAMYFGWNDALRGYYWSLDEDQQDAWWYLNDDQRVTLFQIQAPEQREAAWNSVIAQVNELETGNAPAQSQNAASSTSGDIQFVSNGVVQNVPAPHEGEYPVCESDADDNCINAWAAGQRGPGVDRPLDYWPGEPASS